MAQTDTIGSRVRLLRKEKGWTQEELGKRLGQQWTSIKNKELEYKGRSFNVEELVKLSELFDVTLDELIRGVKTENVKIFRHMGLDNAAITGIRLHNLVWAFEDPDAEPPVEKDTARIQPDSALNAALASPAILQALSDYMGFTAESNDLSVGKAEQGGGYVNCRMSDGMYQAVLGQNLLRIMDAVKRGEKPELNYPRLVFDVIQDEEGGAADGEEE